VSSTVPSSSSSSSSPSAPSSPESGLSDQEGSTDGLHEALDLDESLRMGDPTDGSGSPQDGFGIAMGACVSDSFLSASLAQRMIEHSDQHRQQLVQQLDELSVLYSPGKILHLLGAPPEATQWVPALQIVLIALRDLLGAGMTGTLHKPLAPAANTSDPLPPVTWSFCKNTASAPAGWIESAKEATVAQVCQAGKGNPPPPATLALFDNHTTGIRALVPIDATTWVLLAWHTVPQGEMPALLALMQAVGRVLKAAMRLETLRALTLPADPPLTGPQLLALRVEWTEALCRLHIEQEAVLEALSGWADARLSFKTGFSGMVAKVAIALAEQLKLNDKTVDLIGRAAGLNSLGLASVPVAWLTQTQPLPGEIVDQLRAHLLQQTERLEHVPLLGEVMPYVRHAHERWNGSGLPDGLAGMDIPVGCRIIAVANAYVGLRQARPYRKPGAGQAGFSHGTAVALLQQEGGTLWDPLVLEQLAALG
jgi:HD domain